MPTLAEQWLQEGRAQARATSFRDVLRRLLVTKFGALTPDQQARIDAASMDELEQFIDRVIEADSIAAVLGG